MKPPLRATGINYINPLKFTSYLTKHPYYSKTSPFFLHWGAVSHRTMSGAKCSVSLTVVLVAAVCVAHAQERIKMCGRELIRLAISSCGNSRLRRSLADVELGQHQHASHCEYYQVPSLRAIVYLDFWNCTEHIETELELWAKNCKFPGFHLNPRSLSPSSGDQNASMEEHRATEAVFVSPETDGEKDVFSVAPHWYPVSSQIRRAAGKISDICCEKGCSMKELIQFC